LTSLRRGPRPARPSFTEQFEAGQRLQENANSAAQLSLFRDAQMREIAEDLRRKNQIATPAFSRSVGKLFDIFSSDAPDYTGPEFSNALASIFEATTPEQAGAILERAQEFQLASVRAQKQLEMIPIDQVIGQLEGLRATDPSFQALYDGLVEMRESGVTEVSGKELDLTKSIIQQSSKLVQSRDRNVLKLRELDARDFSNATSRLSVALRTAMAPVEIANKNAATEKLLADIAKNKKIMSQGNFKNFGDFAAVFQKQWENFFKSGLEEDEMKARIAGQANSAASDAT
jgi:hypothetical protein